MEGGPPGPEGPSATPARFNRMQFGGPPAARCLSPTLTSTDGRELLSAMGQARLPGGVWAAAAAGWGGAASALHGGEGRRAECAARNQRCDGTPSISCEHHASPGPGSRRVGFAPCRSTHIRSLQRITRKMSTPRTNSQPDAQRGALAAAAVHCLSLPAATTSRPCSCVLASAPPHTHQHGAVAGYNTVRQIISKSSNQSAPPLQAKETEGEAAAGAPRASASLYSVATTSAGSLT